MGDVTPITPEVLAPSPGSAVDVRTDLNRQERHGMAAAGIGGVVALYGLIEDSPWAALVGGAVAVWGMLHWRNARKIADHLSAEETAALAAQAKASGQ